MAYCRKKNGEGGVFFPVFSKKASCGDKLKSFVNQQLAAFVKLHFLAMLKMCLTFNCSFFCALKNKLLRGFLFLRLKIVFFGKKVRTKFFCSRQP